ncbi:MAG: tetratricopeptide repeat protein [Deltaproteobacteria bacterium]|nr:tetratricopeptide repeat protein [Deltaproteobacteria bacterium]
MTKLKVLLMVVFIVSGCATDICAQTYRDSGIAYFKKGEYDAAIEQFKKQIEVERPDNADNYNWMGCAYLEKKQYEDAVSYLQKAIAMGATNPWTFTDLARCYNGLNQYNDAIKACIMATTVPIKLDFRYDATHFELAYALFKTKQYKNAVKAYKKAIELDPKDPKYYSRWGALLGNSGDYAGAAEQFEKAVSLKPNNIKYLSRLSSAYYRQGKYDEALDAVNKAIGPSTSSAIGYRSLIQRHRGEMDGALKDAKQAYSLDSSDTLAQLALGAAYLDQGRYDEAVQLLSQVKESTTSRVLEATAYAKKGGFKKAIDIYSAILEEKLSPENVPLWSDRTALLESLTPFISSKIETADRLKAQGRYKEALKELGEALKVADDKTSKKICGSIYRVMSLDPRLSVLPEEARKYALRGDVLTEEGKFEEAVKEYLQAVQAAPYIAKLYFNTAMIYGELKEYLQAIRNMKTYLNLAPESPNARASKDQIYKWEFKMEKGG